MTKIRFKTLVFDRDEYSALVARKGRYIIEYKAFYDDYGFIYWNFDKPIITKGKVNVTKHVHIRKD